MKNTTHSDYSFRTFLHEVITKRDMQVFAVQGLTFLFTMFIGLAFVIGIYNAIAGS